MKKIISYIDGYNLYHLTKDNPSARIDLRKLTEEFILDDETEVAKVHYFSAYATWRESLAEHRLYIKDLRKSSVTVTLSKFTRHDDICSHCNGINFRPEEKQTDVHLAVQMFEDAMDDKFDIAYLMSADSDMIPSINKIKNRFPEKQIILVIPKNKANKAFGVAAACHNTFYLSEGRIKRSLFEKEN